MRSQQMCQLTELSLRHSFMYSSLLTLLRLLLLGREILPQSQRMKATVHVCVSRDLYGAWVPKNCIEHSCHASLGFKPLSLGSFLLLLAKLNLASSMNFPKTSQNLGFITCWLWAIHMCLELYRPHFPICKRKIIIYTQYWYSKFHCRHSIQHSTDTYWVAAAVLKKIFI